MQKMKYSGVEWIGEIPEDWDIKRLKAVLCERNESNNPIKTDYILSLTNDRGVIPYDEKGDVGNKSKEDLSGYKLAYLNDIVLNSMNVIIGSVALSKYYGCVSPVYYMLYPRNPMDDVRYYNYIFQTKEFQSKLKGYGNGIMEIRMRIQMSKLNTVELPIPDATTQTRIADFLDDKCGKIDRYIEKQQQIIDKLKEYKQAVITEAVTKGLNPDVPMKDSGIEWIGMIREHWGVAKLANLFTFLGGYAFYSDLYVSETENLIVRIGNVYKNYIITGMGIVEMLFTYILKTTNNWNTTDWIEIQTFKSNPTTLDENQFKTETTLFKKVESYDMRMDLDSMIKRIEKKHLISIDHSDFPALKQLRELRNRVHLQSGESAYDHDGSNEFKLMKRILYSILTAPEICKNKRAFDFIKIEE